MINLTNQYMKHQIKAILFDLDGVVVFTDKYHYLGWKKLADEKGWDFNEQINHACRGIPRMASLQVILDYNNIDLPQGEKEELATLKNEYYKELIKQINNDDLYPGIIDFLKKLKNEGVKLSICSSSKNAMTVLDALNLSQYFDVIVGGNDIKNPKPNPEIFLKGAKLLNMHPVHCVVFEDAESGVEAAHAAKMKCIGIGTPELLPNAYEHVIDYNEVDIRALLDAGRVKRIPEEPWNITETEIKKNRFSFWESVFALSNGIFGVRGSLEESDTGYDEYPATFVNGVCGYEPYNHLWKLPGYPETHHAILNICDWTKIDLTVDGETFSIDSSEILEHKRTLNMKHGIVEREFKWKTLSGKVINVKTTRLVSMVKRHIAALRYEITPDENCEITLTSQLNLDTISKVKAGNHKKITSRAVTNGADIVNIAIKTSDDKVVLAQTYSFEGKNHNLGFDVSEKTNAGELFVLDKFFSVFSTMDAVENKITGLIEKEIISARENGFDKLLDEHKKFWADYWNGADIQIEGNLQDQQGVRFSLFHLRQSNPERPNRSISATGLSGDGYCGHIFWDTEMYMIPAFIYSQPETVRDLLEYRYSILNKARERAIQMQGKGALFAWNSVKGEECGHVYEAATAEYHLLPDIAFAIGMYDKLVGDDDFTLTKGAEIIFEMCRFMVDRGCYIPHKGGKFCINVVCGPDEYGCGVNNNAYTNEMTKWMFNYAISIYKRAAKKSPELFEELSKKIKLSEDEVNEWGKAADNMFLQQPDENNIIPQDDCFMDMDPVNMDLIPKNTDIRDNYHPLNLWRLQVVKQADILLMLFVFGNKFSKQIKKANYDYYEPKTNHGSSLSPCIHNIIACEIGLTEDAYGFFRQTALMDLNDFKNNTKNGIHSACLGGCWMTVVNGFAGMRDYENKLIFNAVLPDAWTSYSFKIAYKGRRFNVKVESSGIEYKLLEGKPLTIELNEKRLVVSNHFTK
ncbi:MAG: beta-phosphoglucomutase [Chlamydiae bacterium]|nr:MAG: beta-phosphoglucomutase [Chlamydiota bacterium]